MAKNKKRKKHRQPNQMGGYKKFLCDLRDMLRIFPLDIELKDISYEYKRMMYDFRVHISNPCRINALISPREVKMIAEKTKTYYRQPNIMNSKGEKYSTYQLMLVYCYMMVRAKILEKEIGDKKDPEVLKMREVASDLFTSHYSEFILNYFQTITQLNNPCHKYYGVKIRTAAVHKDNPMLEFVIEAIAIPAVKQVMKINKVKRVAYRLGKATAQEPVEWIKVKKETLGDSYQGEVEQMEVYIQSHALKRLSQRLDLLDKEAINYTLWENTNTIQNFEFYKEYILLPFMLHNIKVGYLLANIIDDKLLFRTFLFITHNCTPEGDKLKQLTGLGKHDISYWKIDRLSTFVNLDTEKHKALITLFQEAGIEDFSQLKDKDFHVDTLQSLNLEGLMDYIKKGQRAEQVQEEEFAEFLNSSEDSP